MPQGFLENLVFVFLVTLDFNVIFIYLSINLTSPEIRMMHNANNHVDY